MNKKFLVISLTLISQYGIASGAEYFISSTGTDSGVCTRTAPCLTLGFVDGLVVGGDTITYKYGLYTGASNATFLDLTAQTFVAHSSVPITIRGESWPNGTNVWTATNSVVISSYATVFSVHKASDIILSHFIVKHVHERVLDSLDAPRNQMRHVHVKNGTKPEVNFGNVISLASRGDAGDETDPSSDYWLIEFCSVDGGGRYLGINGGTFGYAEWNKWKGNLFRWRKYSGGQPAAGLSQYGVASGASDGARNAYVFNNMAFDFAPTSHASGGENLYGAFYNPQGPSKIDYRRNIAHKIPDRPCFLAMETANASSIYLYENIASQCGDTNWPAIELINAGSSVTLKNNVIVGSHERGIGLINGPQNVTYKQNLMYFNNLISDNANSSSTLTGVNPSSHTIGTNPRTTAFSFVAITSPVPTFVGAGLNGESIGLNGPMRLIGNPGTIYGGPGWDVDQSSTMCDIPDQIAIKSLWAEADGAGWTGTNPNTNYGWAASSYTTAVDYVAEQFNFCASIAGSGSQGGGGEESSSSPSANGFRGSFRIQGGMSYR